MKKSIALVTILSFVIILLIGCGTGGGDSKIPAKLPVIGYDIPSRSAIKGESTRGFVSLSGVTDTEFATVIYCPQLSGFRANAENLSTGTVYTVTTWFGDITISIEAVGDGIVFNGNFPNGSGYFRLILDETTNSFSYVQAITLDFPDYSGIHFQVLAYNCIPQTTFAGASSNSYHGRNIGILVLKEYTTGNPYVTSFSGGESYADDNYSGYMGYDLRTVPNPSCTLDISNLNTYIQQVESNYASTTGWSIDDIDPDGLADSAASYYYIIYDKQNSLVGMSRGETSATVSYGDLATVNGYWYDFSTSPATTTPFTGIGWTLFPADSYSRSDLIAAIVP